MSVFFLNPDGELRELQGDANLNLKTIPADIALEAQRGNVPGQSVTTRFGRNPNISNAVTYESIWNGGGEYTGFNATRAEIIEVFSGDVVDGSAGVGARTVELFGLKADYTAQSETVTLNGTVAVNTVGSYIRMDHAIVRSAGGSSKNVGEITARQAVGTDNKFMVMPVGYNETMICTLTVPGSKTAYIRDWNGYLSGKVNANVLVRLSARPDGEVFQVKEELSLMASGNSNTDRDYDLWKGSFSAKTDIKIEASADTNSTGVAASMDFLLIDD